MATVEAHYANHLAPIYLWMAGGMEAALQAGAADLAPWLPGTGLAVDLGAGFGMHSIPLARAGYNVVAIDSSAALLQLQREHSEGLPIRTVESDLLDFRNLVTEPADLIVCMGDTLTHLESRDDVDRLCARIAGSLRPTGTFVATFRDYSTPAVDERRFIPVRSDSNRILTCFLEAASDRINVHDLIHEREQGQWILKVSSYRKLRLAPAVVETALKQNGLKVRVEAGLRGMVKIVAAV
jgi:2-polyprenyl-3-methyl-5-hydroxy-6-metoxy-1,4-benzoquinol methylase